MEEDWILELYETEVCKRKEAEEKLQEIREVINNYDYLGIKGTQMKYDVLMILEDSKKELKL